MFAPNSNGTVKTAITIAQQQQLCRRTCQTLLRLLQTGVHHAQCNTGLQARQHSCVRCRTCQKLLRLLKLQL
jgi:hypothetical protein